jgi:hypothetical protein
MTAGAPFQNFLPKLSGRDPSSAVATLAQVAARLDAQKTARVFTQVFNQELHAWLKEQARSGQALPLWNGQVIAYGLHPEQAAKAMERLVRDSMTFRATAHAFLGRGGTAALLVGRGGGNSRSTFGLENENVYINRDQGSLLDLVCHEFGHAFGGFPDGAQGEIGPNQRFQAQVKYEMNGSYTLKPYGTEVGVETLYRSYWDSTPVQAGSSRMMRNG